MKDDKSIYLTNSLFVRFYKIISFHPDYLFYKAIKTHRKYKNAKNNNNKAKILLYSLKANRISSKYNLELYGAYGKNLRIWHGNIIINSKAKLGDNVQLHGNNCIGEKNGKAPIIGNNVEIGFGTTILGNVQIANNITIGANSFVNKSFVEEGVVIAGCPAKIIKK